MFKKQKISIARAYHVCQEDRKYMDLETGQQTMKSHVEEFEIHSQEGKRLWVAFTRGVKFLKFSEYLL